MPAGETVLRLDNPLATPNKTKGEGSTYTTLLERGRAMRGRARSVVRSASVARQHSRSRLTVWERLEQLFDSPPHVLYQNWGKHMDGSSLVTAIGSVDGRRVAFYGHDFTVRAGSIDADNGEKLARLVDQAVQLRIPLVGMNDSAGAYVPAGVGGLDGYAQAFTALRHASGVVPSVMCMFGFNAGGGSYLPRQGSFMIQPKNTFFGLTGPAVVKSVLGEDVSADELGGPSVHGASGVTDFVVDDEMSAIRTVREVLQYLPDSSYSMPNVVESCDPIDRQTDRIGRLLEHAFSSYSGLNTPMDIRFIIAELCDHGDYLETQRARAPNSVTAFGRVGGYVTGFVATNSAALSGQIDIAAAYKKTRFIRFCNLYNIPLIFLEDTTGFLPGREQESGGIVQAGRAMLDAIIDVRTPRFLLIVRNAYGGAYASFNNYRTGADLVLALPCARVAVMGPAGTEFVYKTEMQDMRSKARKLKATKGAQAADAWLATQKIEIDKRYEREFMNPDRGLSLGSISSIVDPEDVRRVLGGQLVVHMKSYTPKPMTGAQREFH